MCKTQVLLELRKQFEAVSFFNVIRICFSCKCNIILFQEDSTETVSVLNETEGVVRLSPKIKNSISVKQLISVSCKKKMMNS